MTAKNTIFLILWEKMIEEAVADYWLTSET